MRTLKGWASTLISTGATERLPAGRRRGGRIAGAAITALLATTLVPGALPPASADVGWTSVATSPGLAQGFPEFFDDGDVKLRLCTEGPQCMAAAGTPEYFYYGAEATGGNLKVYLAGIEATYLNFSISDPPPTSPTVVPGDEVGFGRLRFRVDNLVAGASYTITHPYGVNTFVASSKKGGQINETVDVGCVVEPPVDMRPCDWDLVGAGSLGDTLNPTKFLRQVNAPDGWLGDASVNALPSAVTGAPSGVNAVIVEGPNAGGPGINRLEVTDFKVQGQILYPGTPSTPDLVSASDTGSSSADNVTNATAPTFEGTTDGFVPGNEVPVDLVVDGAPVPAASTTTVDGKYSVGLATALAPGLHSVVAESAGLKSSPLEFTVDTVAPVVTIGTRPANVTSDTTPTFGFASSDPGATFGCQLLQSLSTFVPCLSGTTFAAQVDGEYIFKVQTTDVAGNIGLASFSWRIDTVAPVVTIQTPLPSSPTTETTSAFGFGSDDPDATFECQLLPSISTFVPCASGKTFAGQLDGANTFNVRASDVAGNVSGPASFSWRVDTMAPVVTLGSGPAAITADTTPTFNFSSDDSGATFECQLPPTFSTFAPCTSGKTFAAQLDGAYTFHVRATDFAGRVSESVSFPLQIDTVAPTVNTLAPVANAVGVSQAGNLTASFNENVTGLDSATFALKTAAGSAVGATVTYDATTRVVLLNPTATLEPATTYTATMSSLITDVAGNPITALSWSFTTGPSPIVITKSQAVNKTRVAQAENMAAGFSEHVSGVSGATFTLKKTSTNAAVAATVSYNALTHVATLNPTASLAPGTWYTATLSSLIKDADGNPITTTRWSFATGPRPRVTRKSPTANLLRVSRLANVRATFSENVRGVSRTTFTLKTSTGKAVRMSVRYSSRTHVATLDPRVTLARNTRYTVTLSGLIRDGDGNRIVTTRWRFTTRR